MGRARYCRPEQRGEQLAGFLDLRATLLKGLDLVESADFHLTVMALDVDLDEHAIGSCVDENLESVLAGRLPILRLFKDSRFAERLNEAVFGANLGSKNRDR